MLCVALGSSRKNGQHTFVIDVRFDACRDMD